MDTGFAGAMVFLVGLAVSLLPLAVSIWAIVTLRSIRATVEESAAKLDEIHRAQRLRS